MVLSATHILSELDYNELRRTAREADRGGGRRLHVLPGAALHVGGEPGQGEAAAGGGGLHRAPDSGGGRGSQDDAITMILYAIIRTYKWSILQLLLEYIFYHVLLIIVV